MQCCGISAKKYNDTTKNIVKKKKQLTTHLYIQLTFKKNY